MKRTAQGIGMIVGVLAFVGFALPAPVHAATISVQTVQAIPPGGSGCGILAVQNVVPYIYDNALHSYDIVIADPSYVAVIGTVGDTGIPFNQMTRSPVGDGTLRIHVDIQATPIYGSLPIALTLLSAQTGRPVCLTVISFSVLGSAIPPHAPVPADTDAVLPDAAPTIAIGTATSSSGTTTVVSSVIGGGTLLERLGRTCAGNGALNIWFLLITLYLLGVAIVALAEPSYAKRDVRLPAALILVPLAVLLLGFWYFAAVCRAANWVPAVLSLIAVIGLIVAYVGEQAVTRIIQLPAAKPVVPTPMVVPTVTVKQSVMQTQTLQVTTSPAKPKT